MHVWTEKLYLFPDVDVLMCCCVLYMTNGIEYNISENFTISCLPVLYNSFIEIVCKIPSCFTLAGD